ncbi:unnamed protein product [Rotaria magnacalcarata]|uniref:Uncharacterized protein n=1 Tax=Rotaria magnacalcarata TaxID=392030 RepID=A0A816YM37_9BILA|nr:unnamed protein product [Rotaria magnacalcarata]CAF1282378.1 unnamed protein product [Rotaria magnacalcarata]CAF1933623.1 unnamed protein product [Rotaria magnacalcarata]CAF2145854.1 unnamed protein product [Rotaria magnacalcarata]CAF2162191.1 unnamed protein product [Rotaria magnacalcarata]
MVLDNADEQESLDSFCCTVTDLTDMFFETDGISNIRVTVTKSLHLNTPEQTMYAIDIDDFNENKLSNQGFLIEQLQAQLAQNQLQRTQPRDYLRILDQSKTPPKWYKTPPTSRSVYFYDPNYQKHTEQQLILPRKTKPNVHLISRQSNRIQERSINHTHLIQRTARSLTPRTKYMLQIYNTASNYHQQKPLSNQSNRSTFLNESRKHHSATFESKSIPTLPRIRNPKEE